MMNHTAQTVPQKGTIYTQFSVSIHANTTNRKESLRRTKIDPKKSCFEPFDHKSYSRIIQNANHQLQEYLFNLNNHIKKVIEKREANYIAAFENHLSLVEKELKKIKKDAEYANSKERTVSLQEVIVRLQKQCAIFRQQAMKYFQLVEEKEEINKNLKRELELLKRQLQVSEFSKKKIFQKLKSDLGINDLEQLECNPQFYKEFKKTKDRNYTEISTAFKQKKFRKTLLNFDLKNSSQYFKQPNTSRKTARSFLTQTSFREEFNKLKTVNKKLTILDESTCKDNHQRKKKRVNSVIDFSCNPIQNHREALQKESKKDNLNDFQGSEIREFLKQILTKKFISNLSYQNEFKFNSEQDIDTFLENIFAPSLQRETSRVSKQRIKLQPLKTSQQKQTQKSFYPFEKISTHKKLQRVLDSSIYTVQKKKKQVDFDGNDSTVMKLPAKKAFNSGNWIHLRLNKSEVKDKTQLEKNLNSYMERESLKNFEE